MTEFSEDLVILLKALQMGESFEYSPASRAAWQPITPSMALQVMAANQDCVSDMLRIKQDITINGISVPRPLATTANLSDDTLVFWPSFTEHSWAASDFLYTEKAQCGLERGLLHLNATDAVLHAHALMHRPAP